MSADKPETQEEWFVALSLNLRKDEEEIRRFMRPYRDGTGVFITEQGDDWFEATACDDPPADREAFSELLDAPLKSAFSKRIEDTLKNWKALSKTPAGEDQLRAAVQQAQQYKD